MDVQIRCSHIRWEEWGRWRGRKRGKVGGKEEPAVEKFYRSATDIQCESKNPPCGFL